MIGKRLYKFAEHPLTGEKMFQEYEIVGETRTLWKIQPRNIPNKEAEELTRTLPKYDVYNKKMHGLVYFYWSPRQAIEVLLSYKWKFIAKARSETKRYQREIAELQETLEDLPEEEK